ncbi:MAG: DUF2721 domain-containing protein [Chitinophagaceae bacterium]
MELSLNTPALLFPAITLLMLAYTNRFLGLSSRIRNLHDKYASIENKNSLLRQIKNLRLRLHMIRYMQLLGAFSFLMCIVCMFCIYSNYQEVAHVIFTVSLASLGLSIMCSLWEIQISTKAMEIELGDMEELNQKSLVDYIKSSFSKEDNG